MSAALRMSAVRVGAWFRGFSDRLTLAEVAAARRLSAGGGTRLAGLWWSHRGPRPGSFAVGAVLAVLLAGRVGPLAVLGVAEVCGLVAEADRVAVFVHLVSGDLGHCCPYCPPQDGDDGGPGRFEDGPGTGPSSWALDVPGVPDGVDAEYAALCRAAPGAGDGGSRGGSRVVAGVVPCPGCGCRLAVCVPGGCGHRCCPRTAPAAVRHLHGRGAAGRNGGRR